jgi:glutamine amidotransferase-like uncharacterized protein
LRFINNFISKTLLSSLCITASVAAASSAQTVTASSSADHIFRTEISTGRVLFDTFQGVDLKSAAELSSTKVSQGRLIGATVSSTENRLLYFNAATRALSVSLYGGGTQETFLGTSTLATLTAGWEAKAVADFNHDGSFGVIASDASNGEVTVYFFGGVRGTSLLKKETINGLSAAGYNVFGAADLNADGHPDLLLQNRSNQEVMVAYLGGANGTSVLSTHNLQSSTFSGWIASGMQDMNGDGHPDLIMVNNKTGESIVNYYNGEMGFNYKGSAYIDPSGSSGWAIVVPVKTAADTTTAVASTTSTASATPDLMSAAALSTSTSTPTSTMTLASTSTSTSAVLPASSSGATVLIYNGSGTSSTDVAAVESIVSSLHLSYHTANQSELDKLTESQLLGYRLFLMPGGNAITISGNLTRNATTNLRNAVNAGLNYLGICAGGFFSGSSAYHNFTDLTSGVWFNVYNTGRGIGKQVISISFAGGVKRDIYWQDGPNLNGWGKVVAKYPNGITAVSEDFYGRGFVLLSALHPEAPASWRLGMRFSTSLDDDLAFARTLVTSALNRTMLAHY